MPNEPKLWRCSVCGYIHQGPAPPEVCPICGMDKSAFEPFTRQERPAAKAAPRTWRCLNCSHVHEGPEPPDPCPVCGAAADRFEAVREAAATAPRADAPMRVVIVGAGIAGLSAAESLREASPESEITLVSREPELPYYRLNLTRYVAGEIGDDDLPIHPESWYAERDLKLLRGDEVTAVSADNDTAELRSGEKLEFERLLLTIGAHPFIPPLPGAALPGVTALRTIEDARRIMDIATDGAKCVCIGGGVLGMETAGALAKRGADVTLLESHEWPMPRQLNRAAGEMLARHVDGMGIRLITQARSSEIVGDERARAVALEDGSSLPADLVVIATGVRTNSYLARLAGLEVNRGVIVDNHLRSSRPSVLAAGDVAEYRGMVYGVWGPSQYQGRIAGMNAAGLAAEFGGVPRSNTLKVLGLDLFSIGLTTAEDGSYRAVEERGDDHYTRFVFHDGHMVGAILLGRNAHVPAVKKAVEQKVDFTPILPRRPSAADVLEHVDEVG